MIQYFQTLTEETNGVTAMSTTVTASTTNIGLLMNRFKQFINRNTEKTIVVNQMWGTPAKRESWQKGPVNLTFSSSPRTLMYPESHADNICLMGIGPDILDDYITIHFGGDHDKFDREYPEGLDMETNNRFTQILREGDRVQFKNEGIIVIPKYDRFPFLEKLSWMLTAV